MGDNGLKVQITVSVQLQRALNDPSRRIRVLSREIISHFLKKYKCIYFLTTNAHPALAQPHGLCYQAHMM